MKKQVARRGGGSAIGVSVVVTLYNYEQYILRALESVARQTHTFIELIIVDDSSTDNSVPLVRKWLKENQGRFRRAELIRHSRNLGLAAARNTAFKKAKNDYVFVLDADDEIYPSAISKLLAACLAANADVAYSQIELFGAYKGLLGRAWKPSRFKKGNYVAATALVKKSAWANVGGYTQPAKIQGWEDYDFWCKFVEHNYHGVFVPKVLCRYRIHSVSMLRTTNGSNYVKLKAAMKIRHPWLRLDEPSFVRDKLRYCYAPVRDLLMLIRLSIKTFALKRQIFESLSADFLPSSARRMPMRQGRSKR
jgi:glycosyltransferase involved in cell wall biosynthesis